MSCWNSGFILGGRGKSNFIRRFWLSCGVFIMLDKECVFILEVKDFLKVLWG